MHQTAVAVDLSRATWRKSSYSGGANTNCVEVAGTGVVVAIRDSKDPDGPELAFTPAEWKAFTRQVKAGRLG